MPFEILKYSPLMRFRCTTLLCIAVFATVLTSHAQQLPHSLRLADLPFSYNTAAFPTTNTQRLLLRYQNQFIGGRTDLSNNFAATYHTAPFSKNQNWALGFHVLRDKAQDFYQTNIRAGIGMRIIDKRPTRKERITWNLGAFWGALFSRFDHNRTKVAEQGDEILTVTRSLNELDAGIGTQFRYTDGETELTFGATLVQIPQNWSSNGERGINREPHLYFTATALFPMGPGLRVGPAFSGGYLQRSELGLPTYLQEAIQYGDDNQEFVEVGMRFRCDAYDSGAYVGYRYDAEAMAAGFDVALLSQKQNRQGLSLAVHFGLPFGEASNLGPTGEIGLLWEWK